MINPKDLPIVARFLMPVSVFVVRDDSDGKDPYFESWSGPGRQPSKAKIDEAEPEAVDTHNKAMRQVAADNELIARTTGARKFTESDIAEMLPTADKNDRAAVQAKINDGTYDTDEKVRDASEWRKAKPTSR